MFKLISSLFITSLLVVMPSLVFEGNSAQAAEAEQSVKKIKRSKKVPAMRNRVYSQLARAQKLADEGDKIEGFNVLDEVKDRIDSLNSYERAMLFNFYGFMYYGNEDTALAIDSFNQVLNAPEVAILGVSKSEMKPKWNGEEFVPELTLPLSTSYDHRVVDGAEGARFSTTLSNILSDIRLLVQ